MYLDILAIVFATAILRKDLTVWHPYTHYLFYHMYVATYRGLRLSQGVPTMYTFPKINHEWGFEAISEEEIARALLLADVALLGFAAGCLICFRWIRRKTGMTRESERIGDSTPITQPVGLVPTLLICGIAGLFFFVYARFSTSTISYLGYVQMFAFWLASSQLIAIYFFGFRWYLLLPLMFYLLIVGTQGFHRFMIIIPSIYLALLGTWRLGRRWPSISAFCLAAVFFVLFPELKYIGIEVQRNGYQAGIDRAISALRFESDRERGENLLDQLAGGLTLLDRAETIYLGRTYFYPFMLPIPRVLWPEKPALNQHILDVSTRGRPYDREGRVITIVGESYANFREIGVAVVPFILGFFLSWFYYYATFLSGGGLVQCAYIILAATFIQTFRDGATSFLNFGVIQNLPIVFLLLAEYLRNRHAKSITV